MTERSARRLDPRLALAGVLALAIAVRLAAIGSRLSVDEAYSWLVSSAPSAHLFLHRLAASENTPPLFYLVAGAMPGDRPAWLRMPAVIPGILMCAALYGALRPRLGARAALLAALAVAVCPYLITYSDLARGFMLADLALLVAMWALLSLAEAETWPRWAAFWLAGVVAIYTEYSSAICLVALALASAWIGRPRRRLTLLATAAALVTIAPWAGQIARGQDQIGVTKFNPMSAAPSLTGLRDLVVTLTLGENGGTSSAVGRWLELLVIVAVAVAVAVALRRRWPDHGERAQRTIALLAVAALLTVIGHAVVGAAGIDVFSQRYLTILVPLLAGPAAAAVAGPAGGAARAGPATAPRSRSAATALASAAPRPLALAVAALTALGLVEVVRRYGAEFQPSLAPVRAAALADRPRTVLTNTPLVLYYLRSLDPRMDRPYNLGPGRAATCARPCLIVDDTRVPGGTPRRATGTATGVGPFVLTLEP